MTGKDQSHALLGAAKTVLAAHRQRQDGRDPLVVSLPVAVWPDLARAAALSTTSSIRQVTSFHSTDWDAHSYDHEIWRDVAMSRSDIHVERLYLVPHRGLATDVLAHQFEHDGEAAIDSRALFVSALPEELRTSVPSVVWVIDGQVVVTLANRNGTGTLLVSARPSDLHRFVEVWDEMWVRASPDPVAESEGVDLEEPLVLSADLIHGVAPVLCTNDHVDRTGCAWYHGAWQYLRLLDLVSTPTWHAQFYLEQLREAISLVARPRILITGTADYSVLAYVLAANESGKELHIAVVDLCGTPLFACQWYAKRAGVDILTATEDVLSPSLSVLNESWDVICTDAFLTRFTDDERLAVVRRWAELLDPRGRVVTTVRLHSRTQVARSPAEAVVDFTDRATQRVRRWSPFLAREPHQIARLAEDYALRMVSHEIGSDEDVLALIEVGGLSVVHSEIAEVPGELYPSAYLRLVLKHRED